MPKELPEIEPGKKHVDAKIVDTIVNMPVSEEKAERKSVVTSFSIDAEYCSKIKKIAQLENVSIRFVVDEMASRFIHDYEHKKGKVSLVEEGKKSIL